MLLRWLISQNQFRSAKQTLHNICCRQSIMFSQTILVRPIAASGLVLFGAHPTASALHNIFHLTYFSFLADPTSKVLQI
jgi:hypothetical protein